MKRSKLSLSLLGFLLLILVIASLSVDVKGASTLDYTFERSVLYEQNSFDYNNTFNIKNQTVYTEIYNATYSFTGEAGNSGTAISFVDVDLDTGSSITSVIANKDGHNEVMQMYDSGGVARSSHTSINDESYGTIECFVRTSQATFSSSITLMGDTLVILQFQIDADQWRYNDGSWHNTGDTALDDTWYHLRIDFDCTAGGYNDLAQYKYKFFINGKEYGDYGFVNNQPHIDFIQPTTGAADDDYYFYFDAIGFSWDSYYNITDNIIPYNYKNNITEIDKYEFSCTEEGVYDSTIDPVPFFTEIHGQEYATNGYVKIYSDNTANKGIYKNDFTVQDGILNVSIDIDLIKMNVHNSYWYFEIYSFDSTLIVKLRLHGYNYYPNTITILSYYDGSSYINITEVFEYNDYNLYIDNLVVLTNNSIVLDIFPMISNKAGLSQVKFIGNAGVNGDGGGQGWENMIQINSIGIYSNGSSLSNDYMSITINTDLDWDSNEFYLFKSDIESINCSITISGYNTLTSPVVLYQSYNYSNEKIYNVWDLFTGGNEGDGWNRFNDFYITIISSETITINLLSVEGVRLIESSNEYLLDFTYSNIDIQESYFWVDSNNRLQFKLIVNDTNLEHIQAEFNINNIASENRSISFYSNINGASDGVFSVDYISSTSNLFNIPYYQTSTKAILPQTKTIDKFTVLITDNDLYDSDVCTGYIHSISLIYNPDIAITISTLNLIGIMTPLIILFVPPIALHKKFGVMGVVVMFLLMALICVVTSLIPIWLFFIIAFSSIGFLVMKHKQGEIS